MKRMHRNVLLMLSSRQPPDPEAEVAFHTQHCAAHGSTCLVTTRPLSDLVEGMSEVAFYGDNDLGNRYLGRGTFLRYTTLDDELRRNVMSDGSIYVTHGIPDRARAVIELRDVREAVLDEGLEVLQGIIESNELPLCRENIPRGASRASVYYRKSQA